MTPTENPRWQIPSWLWLIAPVLLYLIAATVVNPLREYAFSDDWAYALTVRGLVTTGIYRLHDFLGPSMPFQAYWGALFSAIFGFSLSVLHLSTVVLTIGGIAALFLLAREHGLSPTVSGILALVMVASPLALEFSFTFMTDGQFLSLTMIALALYTRGFRLRQGWLIVMGSFAAACAILVRQFGVAMIPGLALMWFFSGQRRDLAKHSALGLTAPVAAGIYQAVAGLVAPNWTAAWMKKAELSYLSQPLALIPETGWRLLVTLEYAAFFCLPLIVPMAAAFYHDLKQTQRMSRDSSLYRLNLYCLLGLFVLILSLAAIGTLVLEKPGSMPFIPWNLDVITTWPRPVSGLLTIIVVCGAFLFGRVLLFRYAEPGHAPVPAHERLLDYTIVWMVALQLALFQFGDEYLLFILPFALIVIGRAVSSWIVRQAPVLVMLTVIMLAVSTIWARGVINDLAAQWRLADQLVAQGVDPDTIYTSSWEWNSYQGAFDDFLKSINHADGFGVQFGPYFNQWLPARQREAAHLIGPLTGNEDLSDWVVVDQLSFPDSALQTQTMYSLKRR